MSDNAEQPQPEAKKIPKRLNVTLVNEPQGDGRREQVIAYIRHAAEGLVNAIIFPNRQAQAENIELFWGDAYGKKIQVSVSIMVME